MFQVLSYYNINMRLSLMYICTPLDKFSHTRPLTQTLLPLHACTQTLHSHVKLLTHNQSSKLWRSLTQTQTCFILSPASENHENHLSLFNLPTQAKELCPISTLDTPVSLSSYTLFTNRPLFLLLPT